MQGFADFEFFLGVIAIWFVLDSYGGLGKVNPIEILQIPTLQFEELNLIDAPV
jgi:hypothetical protein